MTKKYTGRCACGAVTFEFDKDPEFVANCHCLDCKKASGGEMATFFAVPQEDFTLISGKPKSHRYIAASGKGLDRNFCPECGARLFSSNLESFLGLVFVTLGSLDRPNLIEPKLEMFSKRSAQVGQAARPPAIRGHAALNGRVRVSGGEGSCRYCGDLDVPDAINRERLIQPASILHFSVEALIRFDAKRSSLRSAPSGGVPNGCRAFFAFPNRTNRVGRGIQFDARRRRLHGGCPAAGQVHPESAGWARVR